MFVLNLVKRFVRLVVRGVMFCMRNPKAVSEALSRAAAAFDALA